MYLRKDFLETNKYGLEQFGKLQASKLEGNVLSLDKGQLFEDAGLNDE